MFLVNCKQEKGRNMNNILFLSFQVRTSKKNDLGKAPIYCRIQVNGLRSEFSLNKWIEPTKWIAKAGVAKGHTEDVKTLNSHLASVRSRLQFLFDRLMINENEVTPEMLRNAFCGNTPKGKTICEVFEYHNKQMKTLINKDFSFGTYERYCTALNHTKAFLLHKFNLSDYPVNKVNHEFIADFEFYLKTEKDCSHNTAIKYLTNFKKIMRLCLGNGWIDKDPFVNYRFQLVEVEREILLEHEMQKIIEKQFPTSRLEQVRDIFIFCCFTGLAYSDVKKLNRFHVNMGIDGEQWIKINRTKTDTRSSIPLLPIPTAILARYVDHPKCVSENTLLPVYSNQKMNAYLKEIAAVCEIDKTISFHTARHSFATTVTLQNDVPIETVSKMLGHKSIKTTQHYAKVLDKKVSSDMALLKEKFALKTGSAKTKVV